MNFAAPPVACDPGQAVHYQGTKNIELWVTRSGAITLDNPLRPLTPDVTRVLQVVVAGKVATAYGPDFLSLRRGHPRPRWRGPSAEKSAGTLPWRPFPIPCRSTPRPANC